MDLLDFAGLNRQKTASVWNVETKQENQETFI